MLMLLHVCIAFVWLDHPDDMLAIFQQMSGVGGALAAALLGAAAFAAAHLRPAPTRPAAPAPAVPAFSSEQETLSKAEGSEVVQVTASAGLVSRRDTAFLPPPLGAGTREEEIRKLKQKAAASEQNERRWREQGARGQGEGLASTPGCCASVQSTVLSPRTPRQPSAMPLSRQNSLLPCCRCRQGLAGPDVGRPPAALPAQACAAGAGARTSR